MHTQDGKDDMLRTGEVPRREKMPYSGTDPESYVTVYTLVYKDDTDDENVADVEGTDENYLTEMCSGSDAGTYLRLIDFVYHSTPGLRVIKKRGYVRTTAP